MWKSILAIIITFCCCINGLANVIINGDFQNGPQTSSIVPLVIGSNLLYGWEVVYDTVEYSQFGDNWAIDLDASPGPGGISQNISTVIGQEYELSFLWVGINFENSTAIKSLRIGVAGDLYDFQYDSRLMNEVWIQEQFTFIATSNTTNIELYSIDDSWSYSGPIIDNIFLVAIPEPTTLFLFGMGGLIIRKTVA